MIDLDKQREAFEDGYANHLVERDDSGFYINDGIQNSWEKHLLKAEIDSLKAQLSKYESSDYVLVPTSQLNQWGHMANYAQEYGCPECFESRGYAHNLACEINEYFKQAEAAQENSHE